jgi:hypothetical protein
MSSSTDENNPTSASRISLSVSAVLPEIEFAAFFFLFENKLRIISLM